MFGLGLFATAAYWPGIYSPAMSPKWIALSILAPTLLLYRNRPVPFTGAHLAGCALILWAAITVLWSPAQLDSLNALWQVAGIGGMCFVLGSQTPNLRPFFIAAAIGMAASGVVSVGQLTGWLDFPTVTVPSGLFLNRIPMGEAAALVLIWLIAERMWWWVVATAPAFILADARGATLGLLAGLVALLWHRPSWLIAGLVVADAALLAHGVYSHPTATMVERGDIWVETAGGWSFLGNGFGAFGGVPHAIQLDNTTPQHAHNDALELLWETGVVGLCLAAWFMRELLGPLNASRLLVIAFIVEGCFGFPLYLPTTLCLAALAAGYAVRDRALVRDVARSGRNFGHAGIAGAELRGGYAAPYVGRPPYAAGTAVPAIRLSTSNHGETGWHATI